MLNKRYMNALLLAGLMILSAFVTIAFAAGKIPFDRSRNPMPNLKSIAPDVAKSRCDQVTVTKGAFKSYSTAGYIGVEVDATDSAGAPVKGKWFLDGRQVGVGAAPFAVTNASGSAFSIFRFEGYSAAPRTVDFCIRRQ